MKEKNDIVCTHIVSEPGDMTRYDYIIYRDGPDEFTIAPARSTFRFPQRINYYSAKAIVESDDYEKINKLAEEKGCNLFTLKEVCRTIIEVWEDK